MLKYVDVILPLAVEDAYTYSVPNGVPLPPIGSRVVVPLGKRKTITGIVFRTRDAETILNKERIKPIEEVLDNQDIVTPLQLWLWQWIAQYYMCTLGEVMAAALPSGIIDDNYTAAMVSYVHLHADHNSLSLQTVLNQLRNAPKQKQMLLRFIQASGGDEHHPFAPVERRWLLEQEGGSSSVLKQLELRGILVEKQHERSRLNTYTGTLMSPHTLDAQQQKAVQDIYASWQNHRVCLLYGVTSSGKTEVYIHLIADALKKGKSVLYLVPEIALTTQLTERLICVFGDSLQVYHSRFSADEKVEIYQKIRHSTQPMVVLGARSAVFLPLDNVGLVIVDEEHEGSYKQQDPAPRYHARSVAIMWAEKVKAHVLLGTATPGVESYYNSQNGKYGLVEMKERYQGLQLPTTTMIDLKLQYHRKEMYGHLSDPVVFQMREHISRGKQVILFLNRRGYTPLLQCPKCGYIPKCSNCDVSMTYHKQPHILSCHYCGYTTNAPTQCPQCGWSLRGLGIGTERLEEEVQRFFPMARIARLDLDSTRKKNAYQQIIDDFSAHKIDILIGTQMVSKGLHFNDVSLVVVIQGDQIMNQPSFRSNEQAFQMLEQVSGRAGRAGQQGEVIIQSFQPTHPLYQQIRAHDYWGFYQETIQERETYHYPPFYRLVSITLKHHQSSRLLSAAQLLQERLHMAFDTRCSGVIKPYMSKVNNQFVRQIRLSIEAQANIPKAKKILAEHIRYVRQQKECLGITIQVDVDPQ